MPTLPSNVQLSVIGLWAVTTLFFSAPTSADGVWGRLLWQDQFDAGDYDFVSVDAVAAADSRVFLAGASAGATGESDDLFDFLVRAYDTRSGRLVWEDRLDLGAGNDVALGITTGGGRFSPLVTPQRRRGFSSL